MMNETTAIKYIWYSIEQSIAITYNKFKYNAQNKSEGKKVLYT